MYIPMSQKTARANRRLPIGRSAAAAGRKAALPGTPPGDARYRFAMITDGEIAVDRDDKKAPPPVISADPEHSLERKLKRHPGDLDAKVDVGSDESMDASDPSAAAQPGQDDDPVPSSGFPD
jgi:hypothetical protein